jgi:hypothetical protein
MTNLPLQAGRPMRAACESSRWPLPPTHGKRISPDAASSAYTEVRTHIPGGYLESLHDCLMSGAPNIGTSGGASIGAKSLAPKARARAWGALPYPAGLLVDGRTPEARRFLSIAGPGCPGAPRAGWGALTPIKKRGTAAKRQRLEQTEAFPRAGRPRAIKKRGTAAKSQRLEQTEAFPRAGWGARAP